MDRNWFDTFESSLFYPNFPFIQFQYRHEYWYLFPLLSPSLCSGGGFRQDKRRGCLRFHVWFTAKWFHLRFILSKQHMCTSPSIRIGELCCFFFCCTHSGTTVRPIKSLTRIKLHEATADWQVFAKATACFHLLQPCYIFHICQHVSVSHFWSGGIEFHRGDIFWRMAFLCFHRYASFFFSSRTTTMSI